VDATDPERRTITVVGGGLAGMVSTLELAKRGFDVDLYEASDRLGGKAGSDADPPLYRTDGTLDRSLTLPEGVLSDHGYHVFPAWYTNMRRLWEEIGIDPEREVYQGWLYLDLPAAENGVRQTFRAEPEPLPRQLLSICDLVLQPDERIERLTLQAFIHSRDYVDPSRRVSLDDFILNALTIGDADICARTVRDVFRQWLPCFDQPNWDALRGSLGDLLIDRLEARIRTVAAEQGVRVDIHPGHRLVGIELDGGYAMQLTIRPDRGPAFRVHDRPVVLALPPQVLRELDTTELFELDAELSDLHYLRCNPFAAMDVHFPQRLPGMSDEHFTLKGSELGITGFDISRHWPRLEYRDRTVLQFVAANSRCFNGLDEPGFVRAMVREIGRYFPEIDEPGTFVVPHPNLDAPLYVNDVGTWRHRPATRSGLRNLYFAGDFVRNDTAVTSMEAAVRTGLMAAEAVREDHAPEQPEVEIADPVQVPGAIRELIEVTWTQDPMLARMECFAWLKAQAAEMQERLEAAREG
jgi:predicted NAD/FAD-dependent oxidoreductase